MFARCTTMVIDPDLADQAIKMTEEQVIPWGREIPGFQGMIEFVDRDSGKGITFTLWESEEARQASVERANELRGVVAQELQGTVLSVENYELVIDER